MPRPSHARAAPLRLLALLRILHEHRGTPMTASQIAEMLPRELRTHVRTVQRDLVWIAKWTAVRRRDEPGNGPIPTCYWLAPRGMRCQCCGRS